MTKPSDRLKQARVAAGFGSASEFAKQHDFPEVTYRAHESGSRNFKPGTARAYAKALGCAWQFLLFGGSALPEEQMSVPQAPKPKEPEGISRDFSFIQAYDLAASAGAGRLVIDEETSRYLAFRDDFLSSVSSGKPSDLAVISVSGDSMEPTLHNGDNILIDRTIQKPIDDGIYVLRFDDCLLVKRIAIDPVRRKLTVASDNSLYPPIQDVDPDQVAVVGRVVWVGRRI